MIEHYVASLGLLRGARVRDYESTDEIDSAAGERGTALRFANKYLIEKGALVDFRDRFAVELEKQTGFKMLVKKETKTKADGSKEVVEAPGETEVQYINRFRKAVVNGEFSHPLATKDNLEDDLQRFADSLGPFTADAKKPERVAKPKAPPKWVVERVTTIFANGTQQRWWDIMTKEGVPIEPYDPADMDKNKASLAVAIRERQARREAEEAKQYA